MNRILQRAVNKVMGAFVGSGVTIDEHGQLCLPDGLCPERVHRFIELCMDEEFACPRDGMHALFERLGVSPRAVGLLGGIIDARGDVELGQAAKQAGALMTALPELKEIPSRFRNFLVYDLGLAAESCADLQEAVVSTRFAAAERIGCPATWDAILDRREQLEKLTRAWRERPAA